MRAYTERMAEECLGKSAAQCRHVASPNKAGLLAAYEAAKAKEAPPDPTLVKRYQHKLGKAMYAVSSGTRPDAAYAVGVCSRVSTFPTSEMEACLDHAITYLGQTACDGVVFGPQQDAMLVGYSDSDWHVSHSTSAHVLMYGDACVCYGSRRQHCIAMSSTEAEIIAASQAALEIVYTCGDCCGRWESTSTRRRYCTLIIRVPSSYPSTTQELRTLTARRATLL